MLTLKLNKSKGKPGDYEIYFKSNLWLLKSQEQTDSIQYSAVRCQLRNQV